MQAAKSEGTENVTRREALQLAAAGALALATAAEPARGQAPAPAAPLPAAWRGAHSSRPLPLDPSKLRGLSQRLLVSHHDNNYAGAVKRLNAIEQRIAALPRDAAPFQLGSLKREELIARNSIALHELYFGNLGPGESVGGDFATLAKQHWGSLDAWEHEFRLTGLSLAGGSGWVVTCFDPAARALHTSWCFDHTHGLVGGAPLLVMDMYEHAYHLDYGADAAKYVDAFFANLRWSAVSERLASASAPGGPAGE